MRFARNLLYCAAVLLVSVVLVFAVLLWLESRDSSSLDKATQSLSPTVLA